LEHILNTTRIRTKVLTAAVGAVIACMATPALLVFGAGTAQATPEKEATDDAVRPYVAADFNEQHPGAHPEPRFDHDFGPKISSKSVTQTSGGCSYQ
jgi:hypothetical protein